MGNGVSDHLINNTQAKIVDKKVSLLNLCDFSLLYKLAENILSFPSFEEWTEYQWNLPVQIGCKSICLCTDKKQTV